MAAPRDPWSEAFVRTMIAKGSLTPPPRHQRGPLWYWPVAVAVLVVLIVAGFIYGLIVR